MTNIDYDDVEALRKALIGRNIIAVHTKDLDTYHGEVELVLDNGDVLTAHEHDGGCACANGCFSLAPSAGIEGTGTILGVDVKETVEFGHIGDGSSVIDVFVYVEGLPVAQKILQSEGGDNGYYGWGFHFELKRAGA